MWYKGIIAFVNYYLNYLLSIELTCSEGDAGSSPVIERKGRAPYTAITNFSLHHRVPNPFYKTRMI